MTAPATDPPPPCRFCHGSGQGPVDRRDNRHERVAGIAALAMRNDCWDWSGQPRPRGGVAVEASLAQRLAGAIVALELDGDGLDRVLRELAATHGVQVLRQVLAHLGRQAAA